MSHSDPLDTFKHQLTTCLQSKRWQKLILSKYQGTDKDLQRITIRPIQLRDTLHLSFVYRYKTRDITKNFLPDEAIKLIISLLTSDFKNAHFISNTDETQFQVSKKGKISLKTHQHKTTTNTTIQHNRDKKRFVDIERPFLVTLGITDKQRQLIPTMSRKWKQINKFIEVFNVALTQSSIDKTQPINVVDFGSGKGYLTFAIHDFLRHELQNAAQVTGVELRQELADLCNNAANTLDHLGLDFVCGDVKTHAPKHCNVMIALHACDTATDYAIHYGIRAQADIIMCSPCCHKQLRPQMQSPAVLKPLLQHGVHMGQEAEMLTDGLRALLLEANGYSTKIFEFISLEHTNKNKMILAVKNKHLTHDNSKTLAEIAALKTFYGIKEHCLEQLLEDNNTEKAS